MFRSCSRCRSLELPRLSPLRPRARCPPDGAGRAELPNIRPCFHGVRVCFFPICLVDSIRAIFYPSNLSLSRLGTPPRDLWVLRTAWSADARSTSGRWSLTVDHRSLTADRFDSASALRHQHSTRAPGASVIGGRVCPVSSNMSVRCDKSGHTRERKAKITLICPEGRFARRQRPTGPWSASAQSSLRSSRLRIFPVGPLGSSATILTVRGYL